MPLRLYEKDELSLVRFIFDEGVVIINFGSLATARIREHFGDSTISFSLDGKTEVEAIEVDSPATSVKDIRGVFTGFPSKEATDTLINLLSSPRTYLTEKDIEAALEAKIIPDDLLLEEATSLAAIAAEVLEEEEEEENEIKDAIAASKRTLSASVATNEKDFVPDVIPKKAVKLAKMSMLLKDKAKISVELSASSLDALLNKECPAVNPTRQLVTQAPTMDTKFSGAEHKANTKEALLLFHKFCHSALHFQQEEADNGTPVERMTARFTIGYLQDPVFSMVKNNDLHPLKTVPEVLRFLKDELFGEILMQGVDNITIAAAKGSANVDVEVNALKNLLSFFPETTVGKAKKLLVQLFEGWPLQQRLKEYLLHKTVEEVHVPFTTLAELATNAGRQQEMRPKRPEINNVTLQNQQPRCATCKNTFNPIHPRHTRCANCFRSAFPRDNTCRGCGAPWNGPAKTAHLASCTLKNKSN